MNKRFTIPVIVAMAFHAILLLGFTAKRASLTTDTVHEIDDRLPPFQVNLDDPIPLKETEGGEMLQSNAKNELHRAKLDEPLLERDTSAIIINASPVVHSLRTDHAKLITLELPGDPNGDRFGFRIGGGVPFDMAMLDNAPRVKVQMAPIYPAEAKARAQGGEVLVAFTVDEDGHVLDPQAVRRTDKIFEEAALRAVGKWRFEPGRRQGRVVRFRMAVPVVFSLTD
ncbi:MAG: energy transducer TonB [Opitutaceae bacterium]|nr:energy transducer TonB [Opitutaceae bacterium]